MAPADFRPQLHYATRSTWLNDPNGLIWHADRWHLFYQTNPEESRWGHMSWGHATSRDLLHWKERPIALPWSEELEMFSGSCVYDKDNTSGLGRDGAGPLVAIYTENYTPASPRHPEQAQGLAFSHDHGATWRRYAHNPVLSRGSTDFRDPRVSWYAGTDDAYWLMAAVEAQDNVVVFYRSANLIDWTPLSAFGPANAKAPTWECPDFFPLTVEGTDEVKWVLIVSINPGALYGGSGTQYFVGDFDGTTFTADVSHSTNPRDYNWLDFGADYYAAVSFNDVPDGRRIMIGWMSNWSYAHDTPTGPWRSCMSIPREVTLAVVDGGWRLRQRPVRELGADWSRDVMVEDEVIRGERPLTLDLASGVFNVVLLPGQDACGLRLGGSRLTYAHGRLTLDRSQSGKVDFHPDFVAPQWADVPLVDGRLSLTLVLDRCSIEVFAQGGLYTLTSLVFGRDEPDVAVFADGEVRVETLTLLD